MHILIVGISGSGKDFLIQNISKSTDLQGILCTSYSALLVEQIKQTIIAEVNSNDLKNMDHRIISRAKVSVNNYLSEKENWILTSHIVYKLEENYIFSLESIKKLSPDIIIQISTPPSEILSRRNKINYRIWPIESEEEIRFHQKLSESISKQIARQIECKYIKLENRHQNIVENEILLKNYLGVKNVINSFEQST